jgi:hypothetical protein
MYSFETLSTKIQAKREEIEQARRKFECSGVDGARDAKEELATLVPQLAKLEEKKEAQEAATRKKTSSVYMSEQTPTACTECEKLRKMVEDQAKRIDELERKARIGASSEGGTQQ